MVFNRRFCNEGYLATLPVVGRNLTVICAPHTPTLPRLASSANNVMIYCVPTPLLVSCTT